MFNEIYELSIGRRVRIECSFILGNSVQIKVTKLDVEAFTTRSIGVSRILTSSELSDKFVLQIVRELIEELESTTEVYK